VGKAPRHSKWRFLIPKPPIEAQENKMNVNVPDWLKRHGGGLKPASDGRSWFVMVGGEPEYTIVERPVANKFGAFIKQTNSGKPIDSKSTGTTPAEAVAAGLEDLRAHLGW
jgi:hypothetical protein